MATIIRVETKMARIAQPIVYRTPKIAAGTNWMISRVKCLARMRESHVTYCLYTSQLLFGYLKAWFLSRNYIKCTNFNSCLLKIWQGLEKCLDANLFEYFLNLHYVDSVALFQCVWRMFRPASCAANRWTRANRECRALEPANASSIKPAPTQAAPTLSNSCAMTAKEVRFISYYCTVVV